MGALTEAIAHCRAALPPPKEGGLDDDEAAEEQGDGQSQAGQRAAAVKDTGLALKDLRQLSRATIFDKAVPKMQGRLAAFLALKEQTRIAQALRVAAEQSGEHRDAKKWARFLEGAQPHAAAWLRAPLGDPECRLLNGVLRIAVAVRLGINPFSNVEPGARCTWCKGEVGDDVVAHSIECTSNAKGDNNRRHQWLQQAFANLLKEVGHGQVMLHPHVLTMFGAGAHENECDAPVRARARKVGSITETKEQNSRRQGDIL